jgi:glyoxylase-like metal-dependent hydrolase (beta-lactamase superfamily II)/ferredoxin
MARERDAIPANTKGDLFVDSSCIDCDLCRQVAPGVFARCEGAEQSFVIQQPTAADEQRVLMALVTCPTASIGSRTKPDTRLAARAFPDWIVDDVYFCGYASAASYGASSYLIRRPTGNVLVDSPRFAKFLVDSIAALGGVSTMVLTHRDDVADHRKFRDHFGCERVIHRADVTEDTRDCERIIETDVELAADLRVIHVPGHTRGSIVLHHREVLFTGDHLWANADETGLAAGRDVCWYSWAEQLESIRKLAAYSFTHVLPGHGRRFVAPDPDAMRAAVLRAAQAGAADSNATPRARSWR